MASELGRTLWEARQKDSHNGHEELLVFGYSCKLFRDNEKAQYVDKGEHLIPWMGDPSLMVDRYDVRGALYDLREAESGGGVDRWEGLTEEEKAEEEKCDHERYLALYHDEFQYKEHQDEEAKRLISEIGTDVFPYSQVGFSYEGVPIPTDGVVAMTEEQLIVQQELAAQQAEPQQLQEEQQQPQQEEYSGYFPDADEDTFVPPPDLNVPSGMTVPETVKQQKIIVKTSKFIVAQGSQMEIVIKTKQARNPMFSFLSFDNPLNAYYKHMVSMIKNGRYRPVEEAESSKSSKKDSDGNDGQYLHPSLSAGIKPDLAPGTPTPVHKPSVDCAYSKLINKIKEKQKVNAVVEGKDSAPASPVQSISTPVSTPDFTESFKKKKKIFVDVSTPVGSPKVTSLVDYPSFNQSTERAEDSDNSSDGFSDEDSLSRKVGSADTEYSNIKWPPPDIQMVIDKMASYIIKNGADFEAMVRSRDDPRFNFLKKDHEYYPYYRCKIRLYTEVYGDIFKDGNEDKQGQGSNEGGATGKKEKRASKGPSTISFSIKSREQEVNLDRHSTFPVESSSTDDEDMEEEERERRRIEREERRRKRKMMQKEERERREREERERKEREERERLAKKAEESSEVSDDNEDMYDIFKYAQEMGNRIDKEEQKRMDDIGEDFGADGHGAQPERKMQERRKKAAMFLSRLKKGGGEEEAGGQPLYGPVMPPDIAAQMINSASQSPRSSVASPRRYTPSRSRSHSTSPGRGIPMPPREAPAPPPPPPPAGSPSPSDNIINHKNERALTVAEWRRHRITNQKNTQRIQAAQLDHEKPQTTPKRKLTQDVPERTAHLDLDTTSEYLEGSKSGRLQESSVVSGASEEGRRSQSVEIRSSKSRQVEPVHREKTRSRKKQRRGRSESRSPSNRRERKKRKRSRSRTRRHKKRRSRSRSRSKTHSRTTHKKKRRKNSNHHDKERAARRNKKSRRRSVSSSSSSSSEHSYSSSRSSDSEDEVQVIDSPAQPKRWSRASSEVSIGASDTLASAMPKIPEEVPSAPTTPPLPPTAPPPLPPPEDTLEEELIGNGSAASNGDAEAKEEKKPLFNPSNSAAMAKIAMGLRAKVHALLEKESKI